LGPIVEFQRGVRPEMARADVAVILPGRTVDEAVATAVAQLAGWRLTTDDELFAQALVTAGATLNRRALIMGCPLGAGSHPQPIEGFSLASVPTTSDIEPWLPVLPSWQAAFPPGHPDHLDMSDPATAVQFFMALVDGTQMGPLHRSSCLVMDDDGLARAGIIVNVRPGEPPWGGPWISDIWRDPSLRGQGMGPRLIDRAKAQLVEDGFSDLTLAVTATNDAARTYEREGFTLVMDSRILQLPV